MPGKMTLMRMNVPIKMRDCCFYRYVLKKKD